MCGEKLWTILCKPVGNFRILALFPSFNAYETVDVFETSCEKPVASQPSLQVENRTWERFLLLKILVIFHRTNSWFVLEIFKSVTTTSVYLKAAPGRGVRLSTQSFYCISRRLLNFF